MKMNQVVAGVTITAETQGVEQAKQQIGGLVIATDNLTKGALSAADAFNRQTLRLDATARAQAQLAREVRISDNNYRQSNITLEQHAQRLAEISNKYGMAAVEASKYGNAIKAAAVNSAAAINQRLSVRDDFGGAQRAKDIEAFGKALAAVPAKYDPLIAAGQKYKATLQEIDKELAIGALTEKQHAAARASTKTAFVEQVNTLRGVGGAAQGASQQMAALTKQSSRNAAEMLNISRQIADVGVSLQAGQSLLVVTIQQGAQILDVFASSGRTVGQIFGQAIGWVNKFVFSTAGVVTGLAAIAAGAVAMGTSFASAQKDIEKALAATGRASGVSRDDINRIAGQTAGGAMSIAQAREMATAFAATGKIYRDNVLQANAVTRDFARAMEIEIPDATKMMTAALLDPSKGALDLQKTLNFLDVTTLNYIRTLQSQGDLQGAQKALMDALNVSVQKQLQHVGSATDAWTVLKATVSSVGDAVSKTVAGILELATGIEAGAFSDEQRLGRAQQQRQALQGVDTRGMDPAAVQAYADAVRAADAEVAKFQARLDAFAASTADAKFKQMGLEAEAFANALFPSIKNVELLSTKIAEFEKLKFDAEARGQTLTANQQAALDVLKMQLATEEQIVVTKQNQAKFFAENAARYPEVSAAAAQILATEQDQLNVASAIGDAARIEAERLAEINRLRAQGLSLTEAILAADLKRDAALAKINNTLASGVAHLEEWLQTDYELAQQGKQRQDRYEPPEKTAEKEKVWRPGSGWVDRNSPVDMSKEEPIDVRDEPVKKAIENLDFASRGGGGGGGGSGDSWFAQETQMPAKGEFAIPREVFFNYLDPYWQPEAMAQRAQEEADKAIQAAKDAMDAIANVAKDAKDRIAKAMAETSPTKIINDMTDQIKMASGMDIIEALKNLTSAMGANTDATNAMTDVLSPFYSSDPRETKLGFRAFAAGGIMTAHGELPLKQYQGGGIATSPQVAIFGEGSTPEAYVPAPGGKIPVVVKAANTNQRPITVNINIRGNADGSTVAALKSTAFQQAQTMRRVMS